MYSENPTPYRRKSKKVKSEPPQPERLSNAAIIELLSPSFVRSDAASEQAQHKKDL